MGPPAAPLPEECVVTADDYILALSCPGRPGIVAAVSTRLFDLGCDILEAHQFDDAATGRFFMRVRFALTRGSGIEPVREGLDEVARSFAFDWRLRRRAEKQNVLLLASKQDHCLADLLYRWRTGELEMNVVGIISNHPRETYAHLDFDGIAFHHLPVTAATKAVQEAQILAITESSKADLVVLARYMQILSNDLASALRGRCINIHHSFLPGFKGAKPYHQAHERGVKVIGATAHYVTADLDEGPIIEQDVERIAHHDTPETLIRKGRDIERRVLARAIAWHLDMRVLIDGTKTVVFRD